MRLLVITLFALTLFSVSTVGQADKTFTRDGLTFSYPQSWMLQDKQDANADQLEFMRGDLDIQLTVNVFKTPLDTPEKLAEAKKVLVDRYIDQTVRSFEAADGKPQSAAATSEIGGVVSNGVLVKASLGGSPGNIQIQTAVVGGRMVVMTLMGPTSDTVQAGAAWDMIRKTIKVETPTSAAPAKKP